MNKDQEHRTFHDNDGFWAIQEGEAEGTIISGYYIAQRLQAHKRCSK